MILQKIFDTNLQTFVFYSKGEIDLAPLPTETTPNHTNNLNPNTHVVVNSTGADVGVADEGTLLLSKLSSFNFVGAGIKATAAGGVATVAVDVGSGGEVNTAKTYGSGVSLYRQKVGVELQFRSLVAGTNITVVPSADQNEVIISATAAGETNTVSNLGTGPGLGQGLFKSKVGADLQFKSLVAGQNVSIQNNANDLTISATSAVGEANTVRNIGSGTWLFKSKSGVELQFRSIVAGPNITITKSADDNDIIISGTAATSDSGTTISSTGDGFSLFNKSDSEFQFKSLVAGQNVSLTNGPNDITISSSAAGEITTASNTLIGHGVFKNKTNANLEFKSFIAGANIAITPTPDALIIAAPSAVGENNTASSLGNGYSLFQQKVGVDLQFRSIVAGNNVTFEDSPTEIKINVNKGGGTAAGIEGSVLIANQNTTASIPFTTPQSDSSYQVYFSVTDEVGTPSSGSHIVSPGNKTVNGFDINLRTAPGDGNTVRVGYSVGLITTAGEINIGENIGGGYGIYKDKQDTTLRFKSLKAGSGVTINDSNPDVLTIASVAETNTISNLGDPTYGLYKNKNAANFEFKSLKAGSNITLVSGTNDITIAAPTPGEVNTISNVGGGTGLFKTKSGVDFQFKSIFPGNNITFNVGTDDITIHAADPDSGGMAAYPTPPVHIYLSPSGSDVNPGSQAQPKATLAGAWAQLPTHLSGPFVVHMAAGNYTYTAPPPVRQNGTTQFIMLVGDDFTEVATGTVAAGSTTSIIKTTGLTNNARDCLTIEMTSGSAKDCRRLINFNTTTDINIDYPLTNLVGSTISASAGDTFRMVKPAVVLEFPYDTTTWPIIDFHLINVALIRTGSASSVYAVIGSDTNVQLYGVELRDGIYYYATKKSSAGACTRYFDRILAALGLTIPTTQWMGWGLMCPTNTPSNYDSEAYSSFLGFMSLNSSLGYGGAYSSVHLLGGRISAVNTYGTECKFTTSNTVPLHFVVTTNHVAVSATTVNMNGAVVITQNNDKSAIIVGPGCTLASYGTLTITNASTNNASIFVYRNGTADFSGTVNVSGSNGAFCIQETASVSFQSLTATQGNGLSYIKGEARVSATTMNLSTTTGTALQVRDHGCLDVEGGSLTCSASAPGNATLLMFGGSKVRSVTSTSITNTSGSANSDAIRCYAGSEFIVQTNPTITSSGSSGYGVNCRGGGRAYFGVQPTGVYGATADFTVGTNAGDDFADTQLSTSYSGFVSGLSGVMRTT